MLRFAPSPTGDMHIGNLRVAIFNYLVSLQRKEELIIRIEDTDKERNIKGKDKEIIDILNLFNIEYKEIKHQSENIHFHQSIALQLLQQKNAFNCFCSEETLNIERERSKAIKIAYRYSGACENLLDSQTIDNESPFTVRLKKSLKNINFSDEIKGELSFAPNEIDSFIILRQDKEPTYNFACSVDDMLMNISFIIRGEDHLSNTPKQIAIRDAIGYEKNIKYAHLPIILNSSGKKMSKRDNSSSVKWLLEEGFLPQAITNYLISLGNSTPNEIFTLMEAKEWFNIGSISKAPAKFDLDKLRFINRKHLKLMNSKELSRYLKFADSNIGEIAKIYLEEASTLKELREKIALMFEIKKIPKEFKESADILKKSILKAPFFEDFDDFKKYLTSESGLKGKNFFKPLRILLTGAEHGPDVATLYPYLKHYIMEIVK